MESLFKRLFRYRPTEGRQPKEDWFTESFAAVLDRQPRLAIAYAGRLIGRDVETADIETQRTFAAARPDMWIDARDAAGPAPCRDGRAQDGRSGREASIGGLRAASSWTDRGDEDPRPHRPEHRTPDFQVTSVSVRFEGLKWFEVYRWLQGLGCECPERREAVEFVDELLKFMKERSMSIEIGMDELAAYTVCKASAVEQRLEQLLDAAWDDCEMTDALGETEGKWSKYDKNSIAHWVSPISSDTA